MGTGSRLDINRVSVAAGILRVPVDSVALFETNVVRSSGPSAAVTVMVGGESQDAASR